MPGRSGQDASDKCGEEMWIKSLNKLYTEFDGNMAKAIHTWILTAQVIFPPGIAVPMTAKPLKIDLLSLHKKSASKLDKAIKGKTAKLTGPATMTAGKINWEEMCTQIGKDFLEKYPKAVVTACANCISIVPPGVISLPNAGNLAPLPPIYSGLKDSLLKTTMQPFFGGTIKAQGAIIDTTIKAATSAMSGAGASGAGVIVWNTVLKILLPVLITELSNATRIFFTQSVGAWKTPPGPGNPVIIAVPTPGVISLPATILIV